VRKLRSVRHVFISFRLSSSACRQHKLLKASSGSSQCKAGVQVRFSKCEICSIRWLRQEKRTAVCGSRGRLPRAAVPHLQEQHMALYSCALCEYHIFLDRALASCCCFPGCWGRVRVIATLFAPEPICPDSGAISGVSWRTHIYIARRRFCVLISGAGHRTEEHSCSRQAARWTAPPFLSSCRFAAGGCPKHRFHALNAAGLRVAGLARQGTAWLLPGSRDPQYLADVGAS
jgi:hypothetical protein